MKTQYRLKQDYKCLNITYYKDSVATEEFWIKGMKDLHLGDCKRKTNWFEEIIEKEDYYEIMFKIYCPILQEKFEKGTIKTETEWKILIPGLNSELIEKSFLFKLRKTEIYELLQDYITPRTKCFKGERNTEEDWLLVFKDLRPGDCKIKTDWFKELNKKEEPIKPPLGVKPQWLHNEQKLKEELDLLKIIESLPVEEHFNNIINEVKTYNTASLIPNRAQNFVTIFKINGKEHKISWGISHMLCMGNISKALTEAIVKEIEIYINNDLRSFVK